MNRVVFLIDGFNLYHSVLEAYNLLGMRVKWLDLHSFCRSYIFLFGKDATLAGIYYFSAYAYHLNDSSVIKRHEAYIECLKSTGVVPDMGRFKARETKCPLSKQMQAPNSGINCPLRGRFVRHDEKETDVAIAVKLCDLVFKNECDTAVLITGDTDLAPAVKLCNKRFPDKTILFSFPYHRYNAELEALAPKSFSIGAQSYARHQFPKQVHLNNGKIIEKPPSW